MLHKPLEYSDPRGSEEPLDLEYSRDSRSGFLQHTHALTSFASTRPAQSIPVIYLRASPYRHLSVCKVADITFIGQCYKVSDHHLTDYVSTTVTDASLANFKLFAQYSGAAYCPNNNNSTGDAITCASDACPLVEAAGATSSLEFITLANSFPCARNPTNASKYCHGYSRLRRC